MIVDDPYLHESLAPPWEFVLRPGSKGPYEWRVEHLTTKFFVIYKERVNSAVRMSGRSPDGMVAFLVPSVTMATSTLWKQRLPNAAIPAALKTAVDLTFAAGQTHYLLLVQRSFLRRALSEDRVAEIERWARSRILPASPDGVRSLARWSQMTLAAASRHPEFLESPPAVEALGDELARRLVEVFQSSSVAATQVDCVSARGRAVGRALELLAHREELPVTVLRICAAVGVSQRTLEYAFRELFDLTPQAFLYQMRLHAARHQLLSSDPHTASVTRIAADQGFWHLSRFAMDYRATFGESPSTTLGRSLPDVRSPFKVSLRL